MRMLVHVRFPNEPFNAMVKSGHVGKKIKEILAELKPEATYFTELDGHRGAILVVDVTEPSRVPGIAEPWFLTFGASCEFRVVMSPDELGKAGLEAIGKKWG
jgi:hypothetical protein